MKYKKKEVHLASSQEAKSKIGKLELKIRRLELNQEKEKGIKSVLRAEGRGYRKRIKQLEHQVSNWKSKSVSKTQVIKLLNRKVNRKEKVKYHHYDFSLMNLCTQLRMNCGCSYESICRILVVLIKVFNLKYTRLPCANTIQNWVAKQGLYRLENAANKLNTNKVCLILDESIRMGREKLLVMLISPAKKESSSALNYGDIEVCYARGNTSIKADKLQEIIQDLITEKGYDIQYIVSDEDSKLKCASRLLNLPHHADISHALATCLKKTFNENADFKSFVKDIRLYQSRLSKGALSYLRPPKQRGKARFMNQDKLVIWAKKLLSRFELLEDKAKIVFKTIPSHKLIINDLDVCLQAAKEIGLPLRTIGLNQQTIKVNLAKVDSMEEQMSGLPQVFAKHLKKYLLDYHKLTKGDDFSTNICSSVIESLFGCYKTKTCNNLLVGVTKISLELPLQGKNSEDISMDMRIALETIKMSNLIEYMEENSTDNQVTKRREFFHN